MLRQQTSVETAVLWKETEVHVSPRMFFSSVRICPFHPFQPVRVDLEVCQFLSENSRGCSLPVNWQFCLRCYVSFSGVYLRTDPEDSNLMNWTLENYFPQAPRESTSPSKGWGSIYLGRFVYYKSIFYLKSTLDHATRSHLISWSKPWTTCNITFCRLTRKSHSAKPSHVKPISGTWILSWGV